MPRRLRLVIPLVIVLLLLAWGAVRYVRLSRQPDNVVVASGTIEAQQVAAASKVPGRIERIHVAEGATVRAGMPLVIIEGRDLRAQIDQARAAIDAARARIAQAEAALALQQRQLAAQIAQAEAALDGARTRTRQASQSRSLAAAQAALRVEQAEAARAAAWQNVRVARAALDRATQDLRRLEELFRDGAASAQQLDAARSAATAALAQHAAAGDLAAQAEAALRLARENLGQVRVLEEDVAASRAQAQQAAAGLRLARAGEELVAQRRADVAAARAQLRQAEAHLHYLLVQQQNLVITSPLDGVVLSKLASEGEIVSAGTPILTLADLREVWVRLYIPLPHLGEIKIGQQAVVTTDALPGRTFSGTVTEIAQQAEFTPSNVQTREERIRLVFAVKVTLANPDGLLKPGMPADAVITTR